MVHCLGDGDVLHRLGLDNPWWERGGGETELAAWPRRMFLDAFLRKLERPGALVLAGPRRIGKTVLARQAIRRLLETGRTPRTIAWADLAAPAVDGIPVAELIQRLRTLSEAPDGPGITVLDSIHRRIDWEAELAEAAARFPALTLVAVSALKPKGRAFILPPLTFCEYLRLTGCETDLIEPMFFGRAGAERTAVYVVRDMAELNRRFVRYINAGGFPEALLLRTAHGDAGRHLRTEVLESVLHTDLPALHRIGDTGELNALFTLLAKNTGREVSVEAIAEATNLAKNTVRRYLDVLEAGMLIHRMPRVHTEGGRFQRMRTFKVHLTTPSLHAALFGPADETDPLFPALVESAAVGQWLASAEMERLHFARLPEGVVDLVALDAATDRPAWACQLPADDEAVAALVRFAKLNAPLRWVGATTRTTAALKTHDGIEIWHRPAAQYCYEIGRRAADEA